MTIQSQFAAAVAQSHQIAGNGLSAGRAFAGEQAAHPKRIAFGRGEVSIRPQRGPRRSEHSREDRRLFDDIDRHDRSDYRSGLVDRLQRAMPDRPRRRARYGEPWHRNGACVHGKPTDRMLGSVALTINAVVTALTVPPLIHLVKWAANLF